MRIVRRTSAAVGLVVIATLAVLLTGLAGYSEIELLRFKRAESRRAVFIHAAGQVLAPGVSIRAIDLGGTLARLGYAEVREPTGPGQYRKSATGWDIRPLEDSGRIRLDVVEGRIARVLHDGRETASAELEGEVLTGGGDLPGEDFRPIRIGDAPKVLIDAVLAAEDHRFYEHGALDVRSLARAAWANARAGKVAEGGSTITQQLVKNRLLTPHRTMTRKLREAWLATLVEWRYSKAQILEAYLNEIYLGQRGSLAIRGVGAAARAYFGKEAHQLTPGEAAQLAGMIRAPNTYSPAVNPDLARERRDVVLARMRDLELLDVAAYDKARREPVHALARPRPGQVAPYFTDRVRREVEERFGDGGTRVVTTLDLTLQRFAENAVAAGLDQLESRTPRLRRSDPRARLQAALVALDARTGEIKALVGGRDYQLSQFDRVTLANRQSGSAFKPFVYLTAIRPREGRPLYTAATMVDDSPITLTVNGSPWTPRNYDDRYEGHVTVRRAFEMSLNAATIRVAQAVGPASVVDTARAMGLGDHLKPVPALALGAFEVTPIALARAYIPFASGGLQPSTSHSVRHVYQPDGSQVVAGGADEAAPAAVMTPAEAYLMTSLLQGVIRSGTGRNAQTSGLPASLVGKTGTTNDGRDAWFVGYSPSLVAVVWVGFDNAEPHGLSGAQAALPIWTQFMKQAVDAYPVPDWGVPQGVTTVAIDATTGKQAVDGCPLVIRETFLAGTEPAACEEHGGFSQRIQNWWDRMREWFQR